MVKKGDTLIEVVLAVGIFSMIAVAIVAVMSSGTSGAQTALETTLAREEIDTQAEALRFIQTAYAVNINDTENNKYATLWNKITKNAIVIDGSSEELQQSILQYKPTECSELYNVGNPYYEKAFIINPRALGTFDKNTVNTVYTDKSTNLFKQASTYPRLVYGQIDDQNSQDQQNKLVVGDEVSTLAGIEGIYVIAVKDSNTTTIVDSTGAKKASSFYDFFIRTCWYGSNANEPSTISTVIRLYDPTAVPSTPTSDPTPAPTPTSPVYADPDNQGQIDRGRLSYSSSETHGLYIPGAYFVDTDGTEPDYDDPDHAYIIKPDGTKEYISWMDCISGEGTITISSSCLSKYPRGEYTFGIEGDSIYEDYWFDYQWKLTIN